MKTNKKPFKVLSAVVLQAFVLWTAGCGLSIPSDLTKTDDKKTSTEEAAPKATSGRILNATWAGIESALQANPSLSKKIQLKGRRSHEEDESEEMDDDGDIQPAFDYSCELNYSAEYGSDEETSESMDVTCEAYCGEGGDLDSGTVTVSMSTDGSTTEFTVEFSECRIESCSDSAVVSGSGRVTITDSCEADFDLNLSIAGEGELSFDLEVEMAGSGDVCSEVDSCGDYAGSILYGSDSLATEDVCGTMEEDIDEACGGDEPDCESEEEDGCGEEPTPEPVSDECSDETVSCSSNFECQLFAEDDQSDEYETGNVACVEGCCEIVDREDTDWMDNLDDEEESESEESTEDDYDYWF